MRLDPRPIALLIVLLLALGAWRVLPLLAAGSESPPPPVELTLATPMPTVPPTLTPVPTPAITPTPEIVPFGSVLLSDGTVATPTPTPIPPRLVREGALIEQVGTTGYDSLEAMPDELRFFYQVTVREIAEFFRVRPEDLFALLRLRGDGLLRVASDHPGGVAALTVRQWNGWAAPDHERYLTEVLAIEQYGGYGFDWNARFRWADWADRRFASSSSIGVAATPNGFSNSVAALARALAASGLTRDRATLDPTAFAAGFAALAGALDAPPDAPAIPSDPLRVAFATRMDRAFALRLSERDMVVLVDGSEEAAALARGELDVATAADRLFNRVVAGYLDSGRAAALEGRPIPWPYLTDEQSLSVQRLAVSYLGHTLTPIGIEQLLERTGGDLTEVERTLAESSEAQLFSEMRTRMDEELRRAARGLPLYRYEVAALVRPALGGIDLSWVRGRELVRIRGDVEAELRRLPEYRELNGDRFFAAFPIDEIPRWFQPFGVPVSYQPDGYHTGIDLRGPRDRGLEAVLYAVDDAVVAHVGPLYCLRDGACRGPYAIVLDHGDNVYSIYSHNSEATVVAGQVVSAGQMIGRQGSEGYSRGSHLHLEVHVGVPYSGDWTQPWRGGEFVDPWPWLPREIGARGEVSSGGG